MLTGVVEFLIGEFGSGFGLGVGVGFDGIEVFSDISGQNMIP